MGRFLRGSGFFFLVKMQAQNLTQTCRMLSTVFCFFVKFFTMKIGLKSWVATCLALGAGPVFAQQTNADTLKINELQPVTVTAFRVETAALSTPLSMTRIGESQLQLGTQQLSLDEALAGVPGVFVQNGNNFAQDIRLSIRGFGARSAFGIRGVKVLVDGFPESTPDGTAQVDAVDPGSLTGISVIRSGTGGLYGNASGGSVNFNTMKFTDKEWGEIKASFGSYRFRKLQFRTGGGIANKLLYSLNGSYTGIEGYRNHSGMTNYLLNGGILLPLNGNSSLKAVISYVNSPKANDPGGLSAEEAEEDPKKSINANQKVGENLWQLRVGLTYDKAFSTKNSMKASIFHTNRSFESRLFSNIVELERSFTGGTFSFSHKGKIGRVKWELSPGIDLETQVDNRARFGNDGGKTDATLDQVESFSMLGAYLVQRFDVGKKLTVLPAVRLDHIHIGIEDRFFIDFSDDSFGKQYLAFNPSLGINYQLLPTLSAFLNGSRNFETPTLLEISNGREDIRPQISKTGEVGLKCLAAGGKLQLDATYFMIWLEDEIILFDNLLTGVDYRNAAKSERRGFELSASMKISKHFKVNSSLSLAKYIYTDYDTGRDNVSGNYLPGLPRRMVSTAVFYEKNSFFASLTTQYIGEVFTNDNNDEKSKAYLLTNLNFGLVIKAGGFNASPFVGVNNLFDSKYNANVRINASKPFEPAPPRNFYFALKFSF